MEPDAALVFDDLRPYLLGVAYRLTGSWADAEDAVADAWPRWARHAAAVNEPRAWLTRVVARIALDLLRSARLRRETYVGPWLPEPVVTPAAGADVNDPLTSVLTDESVRMAFLVVLDELTPEQRLAVVLHDVVGLGFVEVADVIGCSPAAARQHATRGRRRLEAADPPPRAPAQEGWRVLAELTAALQSGDADRLAALLAPDVVLVSDGAGRVNAARRPLLGSAQVSAFLLGLAAKYGAVADIRVVLVNGEPGIVVRLDSDRPQDPAVGVYAFGLRDGRVETVHAVLAPDKVARVPPPAALTDGTTLTPDWSGPSLPSPAAPANTRLPS